MWLEYHCQRNKVVKLLKTTRNDYLNNVIGGSLQENPKRFWSYIKRLWSENFGIPILRQGRSIFISDKDNAEALRDYFQSVFTKDNGLLPAFSPSTLAYINNMRDIVFSPNGVLKQLVSLNPSKSAGLDGISPRCLRDLSAEVFKHFDKAMTQAPYQTTGFNSYGCSCPQEIKQGKPS